MAAETASGAFAKVEAMTPRAWQQLAKSERSWLVQSARQALLKRSAPANTQTKVQILAVGLSPDFPQDLWLG